MPSIPFLKLQKDESVYSILARAHCIIGNKNPLQTLSTVTGIRGFKPMSGLPTHLLGIKNNLKLVKSTLDIINQNTHYPLYKHFLIPSRREAIIEAMCGSGSVKSRIGLLRNHLGAAEALRYCDSCVMHDFDCNGFAYWHREHSLSWMYFCPYHGNVLKSVNYDMRDYTERILILPSGGVTLRLPGNASPHSKLMEIAVDAMYLFNKNKELDVSIGFENYSRLLSEKGICSSTGRINQRDVLFAVSSWLKDLNKLPGFENLFWSLQVERSWAAVICSKNSGFHHPLKHMILLRSFGLSIAELFETHGSHEQQSIYFPITKKSKPKDEQILTEIRNCKSLREAATRLKIDVTTLCCEANRLKIPYTRRTKSITEKIVQSVIARVNNGQPSSVVAKALNISVTTVNRIKRSTMF